MLDTQLTLNQMLLLKPKQDEDAAKAKLRTQLEQSLESEMMDTDVAGWYASHGLTQKT